MQVVVMNDKNDDIYLVIRLIAKRTKAKHTHTQNINGRREEKHNGLNI